MMQKGQDGCPGNAADLPLAIGHGNCRSGKVVATGMMFAAFASGSGPFGEAMGIMHDKGSSASVQGSVEIVKGFLREHVRVGC
eukprot:scaffold45428_cov176-Amphora_coffeaeformis.AAC.6